MPEFFVDPDIRRAWTLPSSFYTDDRYFYLSKESIFARCWHFLGSEKDFEVLSPAVLLPAFLDEPVLVTKADGSIHCLSNVCTHRGKILVETPSDLPSIRCGYHGRRFASDGQFISMPEFEGVENFPCEKDNLHRYPTANWLGFVFASIAPKDDLDVFVSDATHKLTAAGSNSLKLEGTSEYDVKAHWALYCENYLEGFHIPFVHRSLNAVIDYGSYTTQIFRFSSLQTAFDAAGAVTGRYLFIFPNLMFNFYDWGISVNIVEPVAPDRSRIRYFTYVTDPSKIGRGAGGDLHQVELEDEAVVESVQKGIRSRAYDRGRYSPSREQGTHHFHRLIAEFIG